MFNEPFAVGDSIIHRIDPRFKVVAAVVFSTTVAVSYRFSTLVAAIVAAIVLTLAAHLNLRTVAIRLAVVIGFLFLLWVLLPLTFGGEALWRIGPLALSRPGVILAAQISLKSLAIMLAFTALITTMNFTTLGHALDRLHLSGKFVHLLLMTYRYIFVIEQEYQRMVRAAKIRGFRPGTNLHTYQTFAYFIAMLFVRAAARADRVYRAMRCRGFNGRLYCLAEFPAHPANWVFAALMTVSVIALAFMEWGKIL
ncbi:MAG: cobalt ECF transporter T component CbiQ [Desulfobacterales bacterium]